jgi:aryl-alcohol dehydrogenase-like predicted oxidoreductase
MQTRSCGKSGLRLPVLGLGCWAFGGGDYWGEHNQDDANRVVRRAVELGVNYFDTAEAYNDGRSEESLGQAIRGLPRDRLIIGTKISPSNTEPATLVAHCEASLRRLRTDVIDLYMVHWPIAPHSIVHFNRDCPCPSAAAAFETLALLRRQGKIRHVGVSNFGPAYLDEALAAGGEIAVNELPYNLLCRVVELEILPYCRRAGVGAIGYMALMQGLLADVYATLDDVPLWQRRTRHFHPRRAGPLCRHGEAGAEEETQAALAAIRAIAAEQNTSMPDLAIRWAIAHDDIACTLVGARSEAKLEANVAAAARPLGAALRQRLDAATEPLVRKLAPSFDYYEHTDRDRTRPPKAARTV